MTQGGPSHGPQPLYVALVWHMHQPFYKDTVTGDYSLPWVRLHALKDYYHMADIVAQHPAMRLTFNFVPSLVQQLEAYANGTAVDRCLAISRAETWMAEEREFILSFFFSINWDRFIRRYPRYWQLLELRNLANGEAELLGDGYYRDLVAWFNLIWIDRNLLEEDQVLKSMVEKGRNFTHQDILAILDRQQKIIQRVIPLYRKLEDAGQIEITTTPYYHPILPLLADTHSARESTPNARLPLTRFSHPEDAAEQLRRGAIAHEKAFGRRARGLWPSEGSVSQEIVPLLRDVEGLRWIGTDEGVLARSLDMPVRRDGHAHVTNPQMLYQPYALQTDISGKKGSARISAVFRDVVLSDRIGFVYKNMSSHDAVNDLIQRLHHVHRSLSDASRPHLVSIILDGENCWEEYEDNGTAFLHELYQRLSHDPHLVPTTVSSYLDSFPPRRSIPRLFAGSWINHNLQTWIGEPAQNRAWEYLARTRQWLVNWQRENPLADWQTLERAWEEIYIAEGSDWFWWYYSYNNPAGENLFDRDFRQHLRNVYRIAGVPSPASLDRPILVQGGDESHRAVTAYVTPSLEAESAPSAEWNGAGYIEPEMSTGAMQRSRVGIRRLYYGFDHRNLYFRVEADEDLSNMFLGLYFSLPNGHKANQRPRFTTTELGTEIPSNNGLHKEITIRGWTEPVVLSDASGQEVWERRALLPAKIGTQVGEIQVPLADLGVEMGDVLNFMMVAARGGTVTQVLPSSGEVTLALAEP